jgi:zinc transport system ATP-binding protein
MADGGEIEIGNRLAVAHNVSVRRGGRLVLKGVDLEIRAGEIVTLIGPNGGGKSTLVRAMLGLVELDGGEVARRPGLRAGYVPQRLAIDRTMPLSVRRFMTLTRPAAPAEIAAALAETGADHLIGRSIHDLSGGEFQRVALARALLCRPELLVLDEPVQGVDFSGEIALYELIGAIRDRYGCGILLVSHDLHLVMRATDRVVCLNGHICCAGGPDAVRRDPQFLRLFGVGGGAPIAIYTHQHDHTHGTGGGGEPVDPGRSAPPAGNP